MTSELAVGTRIDARTPLPLTGSEPVRFAVVRGYIDVFALAPDATGRPGRRQHIMRVEAPGALYAGCVVGQTPVVLIGVAGLDTEIAALAAAPVDADGFEAWASSLLAPLLPQLPPAATLVPQAAGGAGAPAVQAAAPEPADTPPPAPARHPTVPHRAVWRRTAAGSALVCVPPRRLWTGVPLAPEEAMAAEVLSRHGLDAVTGALVREAAELAAVDFKLARDEFRQRVVARTNVNAEETERAIGRLSIISGRRDEPDQPPDQTPLIAACRLVMTRAGIELPAHISVSADSRNVIARVAASGRARFRRVGLSDGWHRKDNGPLLGFLTGDERPVALIPASPRAYDMIDPQTGGRVRVDDTMALKVSPFGYCFYRPFPPRALRVLDLLLFARRDIRRDWIVLITLAAAGGLLGLVMPVFSQFIFDNIIPAGERGALMQIAAGLFVAELASVLFGLTQSIAMLRMETRMQTAIDLALWDRMLDQAAEFYRRFQVGDLAQRAIGINQIRRMLASAALSGLLSSLFSFLSIGLLFAYSAKLAAVAVGLVAIQLLVISASTWVTLYFDRKMQHEAGRSMALMNQILSGIAKLRSAAVEVRAFRRWAEVFSAQRRVMWKAGLTAAGFETFSEVFTTGSTMAIFAVVAFSLSDRESFTVGQFIAFNAAFGQFTSSVVALGETLLSLVYVVPIYERAKPILEAVPEGTASKNDPGLLTGAVSATGVTMRFAPDRPPVIDNVSFQVAPGEFVAIVGPSGSGKTTLLRLLLGFEKPEKGSVFYDGQDLAELDIREVRRQIGVVLQNSKVMPGSIFENIIGASGLGEEEAWRAITMAGFADDVREMPMGLHTLIMEGGSGLSGGQAQRLQIARALVRKPRLLFFDEATSALDNRTQAIVRDFVNQLQATRIVIAHRLSTIRRADRILVLKEGRIVEQGNFDELMAQRGLFADLAARQIAEDDAVEGDAAPA